jgi:D-alanine-D-alanine ligase
MNVATKHVAVLMGGWSPERDVSLDSGNPCAQALEEAGYQVTKVDVDRNIAEVLSQLKPDVAFNALHGVWGEDGCIQGILETLNIPYSHSGVLASALAMDKEKSKILFKSKGIPIAESCIVSRQQAAAGHVMETPYVIKPVNQGSSVGVYIVPKGANRPPQALRSKDWSLGEELMVERYIAGRELTCGVMGDVALGVIDIVNRDGLEFYDYEAKYTLGGSEHILPAQIPDDIYRRVQTYALEAHKVLGCRGVSRADFRYDDTIGGGGELILLEINTQPGMTTTSLVPDMARHAGHDFSEFVSWMVEDATCKR